MHTLEKAPTMSDLKLMSWKNEESGEVNEVRIIKECIKNNLCSKLQSMFGISQTDVSEYVRHNPEYCCQVVFQKWYVLGSNPRDAYPISWNSVIQVLKEVGLQEVASQLRDALYWRDVA